MGRQSANSALLQNNLAKASVPQHRGCGTELAQTQHHHSARILRGMMGRSLLFARSGQQASRMLVENKSNTKTIGPILEESNAS